MSAGPGAGSGAAPDAPASAPMRVLVVDDIAVNQKVVVALMERRGHSVVVANDGAEALEAWRREPFDLVLMDVQMPVMSGLEAAARIRAQERRDGAGAHVPIVALTARTLPGDREECLAAGMDGYVTKPVRAEELFRTIAAVRALVAAGVAEGPSPVDPAGLAALAGDDPALLPELVAAFLDYCPARLGAVRDGLAAGDARAVEEAARGLEGAATTITAWRVAAAADALVAMARRGDLRDGGAALRELEAEVARAGAALTALATR